jgi:hypothetical protein
MNLDEHELEAAHELERRLDRDDERERIARRRMRAARRPRYSRFKTLARITDAIARDADRAKPSPMFEREAA